MAAKVSKVGFKSATGAENGTLNAGDVVTVAVDFSAVVWVTGTPQLWLKIGTSLVKASYAGGSGTNQLTFSYTIKAGQNDANGISLTANSLVLNGGTIKDAATGGTAATLTHAAVADNAQYKVDTTAPTVVSGVSLSGTGTGDEGALKAGDTVTVKVGFSEVVTVSGAPLVWLKVGGSLVQASYAAGSGTNQLSFTYTIVAGQVDTDGLSVTADSLRLNGGVIRDAAGNNAVLTHAAVADQAGLKVSAALPSTLELAADSGLVGDGLTNSATINVKGLAQGAGWQYQVDGGQWQTGSGTSFELSSGTHGYSVKPDGGSASALEQFTLDQTGPTVTGVAIAGASGAQNGRLNAGDVVTVQVVFSEAVEVTGTPRVALKVGGQTVQASYAGGSGTEQLSFTYTVAAGQNDTDGIAIEASALSLNGGAIKDIAGNVATLSHAGVADDAGYRVDTTGPTVTAVAISGANGIQSGYLNAGDAVLVTVEFTEAVTVSGAVQLGLDIGGTIVQAGYLAGAGTNRLTFSYAIAQGQQDVDGIAVPANALALARGGAINDLAGNAATLTHAAAGPNAGYKVDTAGPVISSGATATAIAENSGTGQVVYQAGASDGGSGGVSYSLKAGVGDAAAFSIDAQGAVTLTGNPDYEAKPNYAFTLVVTDAAGNASEKAVTLAIHNVNEGPTGNVTISGTATQGQTLTAANTLADDDGLGTIGYQWYADGTAISGATGGTLTLAEAQVGKAITVKASYTDGHGAAEAVTSSATSAVANVNDAPTGGVTISGTATQGQTLTAANNLADADGLGTIGYQWYADGTAISGATGGTLTLAEAQVGKAITVKASYTDGYGTAEAVTSSATAAVTGNSSPVPQTLSLDDQNPAGTQQAAAVLDASTGTFDFTDDIAKPDFFEITGFGSDDRLKLLGQVDMQTLSIGLDGNDVTIGYNTGDGVVSSVILKGVVSDPDAAVYDLDSFNALAVGDLVIPNVVSNVNSVPTGEVTISGTATQGQTLTAANTLADDDGLGTIGYQWYADGTAISGATGGTLTLAEAQVGQAISVKASYTDGHGTAEAVTSSATAAVANVNDAPTGSVTITGTATQGQMLTAANTLADDDGLGTIGYQWYADGTAISGATGGTLTLAEAQVGKAISVKASYTDGHGTAEAVTSAGTAPVSPLTVGEPTFVATSANPGEAEAISLYLVNQMRHAPQTWATLSNIDLLKDFVGNAVSYDASAKDSLIYDDVLGKTAADYSQVLLGFPGILAHNYPFPGINSATSWPWDRAAVEGYAGGNVTENLAYNMTSANSSLTNEQKARALVEQLLIDDGVPGAGHRVNILMADHSEAGFGFATGASGYAGYDNFYTTQNFGTEGGAASKPYLTGFVLNNADGNLQYNQGEGLGGVTVTIVDNTSGQAYKTTTTATGYWDFAAIGGHSYTVSASGGSFTGMASTSGVVVETGGSNGYNSRSIDFFSGNSAGRVDFAVATDHAPTGTVSIVGDVLVGATLRADVSALADADGLGTLTYRWFVDGVEVNDAFHNGSVSPTAGTLQLSGALSANMLLALEGSAGGPFFGSSLIGHKFSVLVTYTDQAGALEAVASAATVAVKDMNVVQAMARLNDSSYAGIAISDTVSNLVAFCNQMTATTDKTPYHKIQEFRVDADTVISVADIKVLRLGMETVRGWDDCFNDPSRLANGHAVVVQDTLANVLAGTIDPVGRGAFMDVATRIEVGGGSIAAKDLLNVLATLPGKVHVKAGEIVNVTGLEGLQPAQLAQIVAFVGDHIAPALVDVTTVVDSHTVSLTFNENLADKAPLASAFDVTIDGIHVQPTQVSIAGKAVLLTLSQTITAGQSIALTYTAPSGADALAIEDFSGNRTASITGAAVSFAADTTAPTVTGLKILDDGSKIILTYDEELGGAVPAPGCFVVDVNKSDVPFTDQVVDVVARNNTLELTLQHRLKSVDEVTVSYADPTTGNDPSATQDVSGNDAASFTAMPVSTVNVPYSWNYDTSTGADTINGTAENDVVFANLGADEVNGGDGNDYLDGGYFAMTGTDSSSNIIHGGNGDDEIYGASGADQLYGDAGNDFIYASGGADTVNGGTGADVMSGRSGSDTFVFAAGDSGQTATTLDTIRDYAKGAVGTGDLISYSTALTIGGSSAAATDSQAAVDQTSAVASFATGSGTTLDDALNDIAARFTEATDSAGELALFKVGATGSYYLFISDGVAGVTANDVVVQLTGVTAVGKADLTGGKLTLQDGGPVFQGATTSDDGSKIILTYDQALSTNAPLPESFSVSVTDSWGRVTFGDGVSSVSVNGSTVELTLNKAINRYDGVTVSYTDPTAADDNYAIQEVGGVDAISLSSKSVAHSSIAVNAAVSGTASGETINGTSGNDQIYALGGSDTVYGGDGNDILDVGLYTSSGSSVNESVANIASGGNGDDEIYGGKGADTLYGGAGSDVLVGYYEHDVLIGGTGGDYLAGSSSTSSGAAQYNDTFVFAPGDSGQTVASVDSILDLKKGAVGTGDLIRFVQDSSAGAFTGISMAIGGAAATATADSASINQATGVATFVAGSGASLADALHDVAASMTGATDSAGEFAFFKVNGTGDYFLFMSDGNAGVTSNDVVVQMVGVTSISGVDLSGGNLTILS